MKHSIHFKKFSNSEARQAAIDDMKKDGVKHRYLNIQGTIISQPIVGVRMGLFGL